LRVGKVIAKKAVCSFLTHPVFILTKEADGETLAYAEAELSQSAARLPQVTEQLTTNKA